MLKLDLHIHSCHSPDGITSWSKIIRNAKERGLDGISITDHDFLDPEKVRRKQEETDLLLIPGQEISSNLDHILAYFIESPVEPWRDPNEIIEDIHQQGGIAVAAHPYRLVKNYPQNYFKQFDAIEVFNGRSGEAEKKGTPNYYANGLAEEFGFNVTGGSDSHLSWTIGNGVTHVDTEKNLEAVRRNLLNNSTRVDGTPSLQSNRALSQFVRLFKQPSLEAWLKYPPKGFRYVGKDLTNF